MMNTTVEDDHELRHRRGLVQTYPTNAGIDDDDEDQ
jgi:hypothetical protein